MANVVQVFDILQKALLDQNANFHEAHAEAEKQLHQLNGIALARGRVSTRLLGALQDPNAGTLDVCVLFRQVIRAYARRLLIADGLWQKFEKKAKTCSLVTYSQKGAKMVEVDAVPWSPDWLPTSNIEAMDVLAPRFIGSGRNANVTGNGTLHAFSGGQFAAFLSPAHKAAVETSLFAPSGSTLLITLPTGGGKSLCVTLPAWVESHGGRAKGGTTVVVVPTVSLALDQEQHAIRYFGNVPHPPRALTGGTPPEIRQAIYRDLEDGTLPLLFTSPEAILNGHLYDLMLSAANSGTLKRLVIDEAHLVETWGARFRTEFQLLSAFRDKLLSATDGELQTILLSATISNSCENTLLDLFADGQPLLKVQANQLRSEIAYWFSLSLNDWIRRRRVMEAIRFLPRPFILYVTSPENAEKWVKELKHEGFRRVAAYTGRTNNEMREVLSTHWIQNDLDIMVATSAFGVGLDKPDVRAVIHATMPENVDRFYQEVGRGGRDGFSSISLLCASLGDDEQAFRLTTTNLITAKTAWPRWESMHHSSVRIGDRRRHINTNAVPSGQSDMRQGEKNREWNEHILLLMQRAKLIRIIDSRQPTSLEQSNQFMDDDRYAGVTIELIEPSKLNDWDSFEASLSPFRDEERGRTDQALQTMWQMIERYSQPQADLKCLASVFVQIYPNSTRSCGGCPSCRQGKIRPYQHWSDVLIDLPHASFSAEYLSGDLREIIGHRRTLIIMSDDQPDAQSVLQLVNCLIDSGFQQIVLPDDILYATNFEKDLVRELSAHAFKPHRIVSISWLLDGMLPIFALPTVVFYETDRVEDIFQAISVWAARQTEQPWIAHAVPRNLILRSRGGRFVDKVDGIRKDWSQLVEEISPSDQGILGY